MGVDTSIYKERTKKWHDKRIVHRELTPGQHVLLYNTRLNFFPGKLKSRWSGLFVVRQIFPFGIVEISDLNSKRSFRVNGQRLKMYVGGVFEKNVTSAALTSPQIMYYE